MCCVALISFSDDTDLLGKNASLTLVIINSTCYRLHIIPSLLLPIINEAIVAST